MALTYDQITGITQKYFMPKIRDNIFSSNSLMDRIKKGKMYKSYDGGTTIMVPVEYATTTAAGWYDDMDALNVSDNPVITAAEFNMKQIYANIVISRKDELRNSGKAQMIDFVKTKMANAKKTIADTMGTALYNAGSTTDAIIGLRAAVLASGTYGGIARASNSWWNGQVDSSTTSLTLAALRSLNGDCTVGNGKPTVHLTTQDQFDTFYNLLTPVQRFSDSKTADAGFQNLLLEGKPVIVDSHVPSGYWFMINEEFLKLNYHTKENFRFEAFKQPINQNAKYAKIYWAGALTVSNCRMNGVFTSLT